MKSHITSNFRTAFDALPDPVKHLARDAYRRFQANPNHPSLRFKPVQGMKDTYSVRIGPWYRALGTISQGEIYWDWIGHHSDYDKLIP